MKDDLAPLVSRGVRAVALLALLGTGACAGNKDTLRPSGPDEPLITEEEGLRDPPARRADRPPAPLGDAPLVEAPTRRESPRDLPDGAGRAEGTGDEPAPAGEVAPARSDKARGVRYAGPKGTIRRTDLVALLDRRPAAFLRHVDSEPRVEGGRFRGWRINNFFPEDNRFQEIDLVSGDVVTRVNGRPIEQPDQFIQVWEEMRLAKELRVDLLRNGQPHVSRWTIVD